MADKKWEVVKVRYCGHVSKNVALEAEKVYPAEYLPDQPARVMAHRCTEGIRCMLENRPSCVWAGSNPAFDPFLEQSH